MKFVGQLFFVIFSLSLAASQLLAAENSDFERKINECNLMVAEDKLQNALDLSAQLIKQNKTSRDAFACKGRAELALYQATRAIDTFKQVNQLSTTLMDKVLARALLGNAYKANNQPLEALESYKQALELSKSMNSKGLERVSHELIASALFWGEKNDEALSEYQIALKLAQNDGERAKIFEHIAEILEHQSKQDEAIEYQIKASLAHTRYSDIDSQVNAQLELGRMYINAKLFEQAKVTIDKVLKVAEGNSDYWEAKGNIYLARLMFMTEKDKEATELLIKADKLNQKINDKALNVLMRIVSSQQKLPSLEELKRMDVAFGNK